MDVSYPGNNGGREAYIRVNNGGREAYTRVYNRRDTHHGTYTGVQQEGYPTMVPERCIRRRIHHLGR